MSKQKTPGRLVVISAPSGCGKTTLVRLLNKSRRDTCISVSMTTRPRRVGERDKKDYYFVSEDAFRKAKQKGALIESAKILKHSYGTPKKPIEQAIRKGKFVLLGIDVQGARQLRKCGLPTTTIFILPPSLKALKERLTQRGTETRQQIQERLALAKKELQEVSHYDYAVVNDALPEAQKAIASILDAQRYRVG